MRFKLLILFIICCSITHSQILDKSYYLLDSLDQSKINPSDLKILNAELKNYNTSTNDTVKLNALSVIVENCFDEKIWSKYNLIMLKIAREKQKQNNGKELIFFKGKEALAINNIGYYFFNYTIFTDSALHYYKIGMKLNEEIANYNNLVVSYSNVANVYQIKGDLIKAMELYNKALSYYDKVSDKTGITSSLNNLSNIYLYLNDTDQSILNLKKCFILAQFSHDKNMKAHVLHNIGVLSQRKNYNEALQSVKSSLTLRKEIGDKKGIAQSLLALATLADIKNNYGLMQQYLDEAKPIIDEINNPFLPGLYYRELGQLNQSIGNAEKGLLYYTKALTIFEKNNSTNEILEMLRNAITLCGQNPKFKLTKLDFYEKFYKYEKLQNKTAAQKISMQQKYENQIKIKDTEYKAEQEIKDEKNRSEKRKQQYITLGITSILIISLIFSYFIFKALKLNREKTEVINQQKIIVEQQKHLVEEKQKEIIDSINYSKRIQNSFLPSKTEFSDAFPNSFIIYQPKDIVSGDFYWMMDSKNYPSIKNNFKGIAVADCTGHGVPGAMLSMLGSSILNQAILESSVQSPSDILNFLNSELKKNLRSNNNEIIRDGMDISCCMIFSDTLLMKFTGANNPCWIIRENKIVELKATKQAVTASKEDDVLPFSSTEIQLFKNDLVVLFTDGYADQFGGPKGKKFKYAQLEKILLESSQLSAQEQQVFIQNKFNFWKGSLEQVDDVCIIGIRI